MVPRSASASPGPASTIRRPRPATPEKRRKLLDGAEHIMLRDGYAAVTSRRLETETGLKVHYHFGSIDDLFIAVVRRRGEINLALMAEALSSSEPLRAWWRLASDRRGSRLLVEITAAANHRPSLQVEVATFARETRRLQLDALDHLLNEYGIDRESFPPRWSRQRSKGSHSLWHTTRLEALTPLRPKRQLPWSASWIGSKANDCGSGRKAASGGSTPRAPLGSCRRSNGSLMPG